MKLLINDKEIAHFLCSIINTDSSIKDIRINEKETASSINWVLEKKNNAKDLDGVKKFLDKIKEKIEKGVAADTRDYINNVKTILKNRYNYNYNHIHKNLDYFMDKLGEDVVLELYKFNKKQNFVKSVGFNLDLNSQMVRRKHFNSYQDNCLIRNTVGNEDLLISKISNNYPFWFIDSGYTNFVESNKKWHRLVHNHLHHGVSFQAPVDRLGIFKSFPEQWRRDGEIILVIEPGPFAAGIFNVDINSWKYQIEEEIRKYSDKRIVFREKTPKKKRSKLYTELLNDDYYCVININSNAATESVWAGVPIITLDQHITNTVARKNISDINDLYRGQLAEWLAMVSYSQFTFDELIDGTAGKIIKKYHV
jgi:hypothetical protein